MCVAHWCVGVCGGVGLLDQLLKHAHTEANFSSGADLREWWRRGWWWCCCCPLECVFGVCEKVVMLTRERLSVIQTMCVMCNSSIHGWRDRRTSWRESEMECCTRQKEVGGGKKVLTMPGRMWEEEGRRRCVWAITCQSKEEKTGNGH